MRPSNNCRQKAPIQSSIVHIYTFPMETAYQKKNAAALFLTAVLTGLTTASLALPWFRSASAFYKTSDNVLVNSTDITYDLFGTHIISLAPMRVTSRSHICGGVQNKDPGLAVPVESYESLKSASTSSVSSIFRLSQASTIIASLTTVLFSAHLLLFSVDSIRNLITHTIKFGSALARNIPHVLCFVLICSVLLSFLAFLGLNAAFKNDFPGCDTGPCQSLSGSASYVHDASVVSVTAWAPQSGWFVALASVCISLFAASLVATNQIPPTYHSCSPSGDQDELPMVNPASSAYNSACPPLSISQLDVRARAVLCVAAVGSMLITAVIAWVCIWPQCATCASSMVQSGSSQGYADVDVLKSVVESIEMQVQPSPPAAWPSLEDGHTFYQNLFLSLATVADFGLEFDANPLKTRVVARALWHTLPKCEGSNCSLPVLTTNVRYRKVISGSGYGSGDFTMKQSRRFRQNAAALPLCTIADENADCKAKIEANYYWKGAESSDVDITWQRSCTLRLKSTPSSEVAPPVISSVRDVQSFFTSTAAAFGANSENATLYERGDCLHESEYTVSETASAMRICSRVQI